MFHKNYIYIRLNKNGLSFQFKSSYTSCITFLKGLCVLVRVEIIHKSKSLPGTVEKISSTIRTLIYPHTSCMFLISSGRPFHKMGATTEKALLPYLLRVKFGTVNNPLLVDLKSLLG